MNLKIITSKQRKSEPEPSILYVVGTPIGNLNDISERCKNLLTNVSMIACEDTRHTKHLLSAFNIKNKLISFNEYNSSIKTDFILNKLKEGLSIALVSDAGLPAISDPGEYLVKKVLDNSFEVICAPGPCAALTGLVSSGLPSENFLFMGFLPKKNVARKSYYNIIADNVFTTIVYESPKRVKTFLKELSNYCEDSRKIHIANELTKKYEKHWNGKLKNITEEIEKIQIKGEFTIIIEGKRIKENNLQDLQSLKKDLEELTNLGLKRSAAASYLSNKNRIPKNIIYNLE
tara:strand:+ start:821 stop:1687 length:867 start_codon:yes stop_codon:yes gene_type:complete